MTEAITTQAGLTTRKTSGHYALAKQPQASRFFGKCQQRIAELSEECCHKGWDGYGAEAISTEVYVNALEFSYLLACELDKQKRGFPLPELSAEADGEISFDWEHKYYNGSGFNVSVGLEGLSLAVIIYGEGFACGEYSIEKEVVKRLAEKLLEFYESS